MSTLIESKGLEEVRVLPPTQPLIETLWKAWVQKGRANERRGRAAHVRIVTWVSIAALIGTAVLWNHLTPTYEAVVRFIVTGGALVVMFRTLAAREHAFAAVFGAFVVLYNPVAPLVELSVDWQRALVVASAIPFFASLERRSKRPAHNG